MMVKTCISPGDVLQNENSPGHKSPARSLDIHLFSLGNMRMMTLPLTSVMMMNEEEMSTW